MAISEETKKTGLLKPIIIVLIAFLMVPTLTVAIIYYTSESFRYKADEFLTSFLPGSMGEEFAKKPTKEEREQLKIQIAKQYITYEDDRLADKLQIIKAEDLELYNEMRILLNRENGTKMARVQEILRRAELKEDSFQRIFEELELDRENSASALVKYYTSLKASAAVQEIERTFSSGELTLDLLPLVFQKLSVEQSAIYLEYLNEDLHEKIKLRLPPTKNAEVEKQLEGNLLRVQQLKELAKIYEESSLDEIGEDLGTNNKFNHNDLAQIYQVLSLNKAGQILARVQDQEFSIGLYEAINELEKLNKETKDLSNNLAPAVLIYQDYETKVGELALVYQRLPINEMAAVVNEMLSTSQVYQRHQLEGGTEITFTQEQLVVDVLRKLKPTLVAKLLEELDTSISVELSKKLITK